MAVNVKARQQKISKDVAVISEKVKKTRLKASDLIIPISVGIVLLLLTLFVFVPMITSALEYQDEIRSKKEQIETLNTLNNTVDSIDQIQITDDVIVAKKVIPRILKVSDFIYYVDSLATSKGLQEKELSAGDSRNRTDGGEGTTSGVTGPVQYTGSFTNVVAFLEEVQSTTPYIVSIKNVELSKVGATDEWSVSLSVSGYYLEDNGSDSVNLYSPFRVYTTYESVMEIFREKASEID